MERRGCYKSLEEIYSDNRKLVFTFIQDHTNDLEITEELAAAIWLKICEYGDRILNLKKKKAKAYIRQIAAPVTADYFRKEAKEKEAAEKAADLIESSAYWDSIDEEFFKTDRRSYLYQSTRILTEEEKTLIVLRFSQDLSAKEAGELLGIKEGTVRVRQLRILSKLRAEIERLIDAGKEDA